MVEFCEKCGGMLLPNRENNTTILKCNLCGKVKSINDDLKEEYTFRKTIEHPKGSEFKNLEKMENWREKKKK